MSSSHHFYLGPFIEVENPDVDSTMEIRTCSNENCPRYNRHRSDKDHKFCYVCGTSVASRTVLTKDDGVNLADLSYKEFNESLFAAGWDGDFLIPNRETPRTSRFSEISSGGYTDLDKEADLAWFNDFYAKEIARLKELLPKVEVKWGVVVYIH